MSKTSQIESVQVGWVNTDNSPVKTEHVCYSTYRNYDEITLVEYVREYFPHPEAPEHATIFVLRSRNVKTYKTSDKHASAALLVEYAQNNCSVLFQ